MGVRQRVRHPPTGHDVEPDGEGKPAFVDRLAYHYSEWNALHPFREGNGCATREFMAQLARGAGYELDQTQIDNSKDQWNEAARRSFSGDLEPIKAIFREAVRYSRAVAFEKIPETVALARYPELREAFDTLKAASSYFAAKMPDRPASQEVALAEVRRHVQGRLDQGEVGEFQRGRAAAGQVKEPGAGSDPEPPKARQRDDRER